MAAPLPTPHPPSSPSPSRGEGTTRSTPHPLTPSPSTGEGAGGGESLRQPYPVEEIERLIRSRRSVRLYEKTPVPDDVLRHLVDLARWAPSGMNAQPWKFVIVRNRGLLDEIRAVTLKGMDLTLNVFTRPELKWKLLKGLFRLLQPGLFKTMDPRIFQGMRSLTENKTTDTYHKAPALILVLGDTRSQTYMEDCSAATQNLALAAHAVGLGTCWIGFAKFLNYSRKMKKKLHVPKGWTIVSVSTVGYPWEGTLYDQPSDRKELEIEWLD